jgi:hypothetical protein
LEALNINPENKLDIEASNAETKKTVAETNIEEATYGKLYKDIFASKQKKDNAVSTAPQPKPIKVGRNEVNNSLSWDFSFFFFLVESRS